MWISRKVKHTAAQRTPTSFSGGAQGSSSQMAAWKTEEAGSLASAVGPPLWVGRARSHRANTACFSLGSSVLCSASHQCGFLGEQEVKLSGCMGPSLEPEPTPLPVPLGDSSPPHPSLPPGVNSGAG